MNMFAGLLLGALSFLIIGLFHPLVVKTEYYCGTRAWPLFALAGVGLTAASVALPSLFWSALCGITGFSLFWSIKELFEQEERVRKGWFPMNPKRRRHYETPSRKKRNNPPEKKSINQPEKT